MSHSALEEASGHAIAWCGGPGGPWIDGISLSAWLRAEFVRGLLKQQDDLSDLLKEIDDTPLASSEKRCRK